RDPAHVHVGGSTLVDEERSVGGGEAIEVLLGHGLSLYRQSRAPAWVRRGKETGHAGVLQRPLSEAGLVGAVPPRVAAGGDGRPGGRGGDLSRAQRQGRERGDLVRDLRGHEGGHLED